jgi:hypothetical protein
MKTSDEPLTPPASRTWVPLAVVCAWMLLFIGSAAANVTVTNGRYGGVLLTAISSAAVAAILLSFALWRGGIVTRVFALLGIAPILFIVSEFVRRF